MDHRRNHVPTRQLLVGVPNTIVATCLVVMLLLFMALTQDAHGAPVFSLKWGGQGTGPGKFRNPVGIAVGPDDNVYVADGGTSPTTVQVFTPSGQWIRTVAGDTAAARSLNDVAVGPDGSIYCADRANARITKRTSDGTFVAHWDTRALVGSLIAAPMFLATDAAGNILATVQEHVLELDPNGHLVALHGSPGWGVGQFQIATGIAIAPDQRIVAADYLKDRVLTFPHGGAGSVLEWGVTGTDTGEIAGPNGIAVSPQGVVVVLDLLERIQHFTLEGEFLELWGRHGDGNGEFQDPNDVAFDSQGAMYIVDAVRADVQKFVPASTPTRSLTWGKLKARYR